jgi:heat-inducible transcriptional repressor
MERLTERQERILNFIVRDYIDTATPVGSKAIVEREDLGVSSATVRNEMADLEQQGYLTHPHTSAGRIPTAEGYRYFIEHLMEETRLTLTERRMIEHQFHQVDMELEQWIRLTATILTSRSSTASLVTAPRARRSRLKRLELVPMSETTALLLLVLHEGTIKRRIIDLGGIRSRETLSALANELNTLLPNLNSEEVRAKSAQLKPIQEELGQYIAELMGDLDLQHGLELHRYGLAHILKQPEFAETEKMERVVGILEQPGYLEAILAEIGLSPRGVQIIIGGEDRWPEISDLSLVLARYGLAWEITGVVGLMGPTRMPYGRNIPIVSYMANLMSKLVRGWYSL